MFKKTVTGLLLGVASLMISSFSHALPITGSLTLTDEDVLDAVFWSGSFTTADITANEIAAGQVAIDTLTLTDVTALLPAALGFTDPAGVNVFGDFSTANITAPVTAFLNATGTNIIGLVGSIVNSEGTTLVFQSPNASSGDSYRWFATNTITVNGESGIQVVPEPASLALFGIGLVGLGFAKRRRMNTKS